MSMGSKRAQLKKILCRQSQAFGFLIVNKYIYIAHIIQKSNSGIENNNFFTIIYLINVSFS